MEAFRDNAASLLLTTPLAARGLDLPQVCERERRERRREKRRNNRRARASLPPILPILHPNRRPTDPDPDRAPGQVTHVYNIGVPADSAAYVHRAGRVGRIGAAVDGSVTTLCDQAHLGQLRALADELGLPLRQRDEPAEGDLQEAPEGAAGDAAFAAPAASDADALRRRLDDVYYLIDQADEEDGGGGGGTSTSAS